MFTCQSCGDNANTMLQENGLQAFVCDTVECREVVQDWLDNDGYGF